MVIGVHIAKHLTEDAQLNRHVVHTIAQRSCHHVVVDAVTLNAFVEDRSIEKHFACWQRELRPGGDTSGIDARRESLYSQIQFEIVVERQVGTYFSATKMSPRDIVAILAQDGHAVRLGPSAKSQT